MLQRGEVVLVPFPFSDFSATKVRPAIIVSGSACNTSEPDIILGALTSRIPAAGGPFDYVLRDWQKAGLQLPSAFKPVLATVDPARVVHSIGMLSRYDQRQVEERLRVMLGL